MGNNCKSYHIATFAGGCFWCTASAFDGQKGIVSLESGYIGGQEAHPTYEQVCTGKTGHYEAVRITYDPDSIAYSELLSMFFAQIDPTDDGGSFIDRGPQYRSAVFYYTDEQKQAAESAVETINRSGLFERPVATKVLPSREFFPAETYHQGYHKKNPVRYKYYRAASGRDIFIDQHKKDYGRLLHPKVNA